MTLDGHTGLCHLDGGFDHRQHEALDAEPVMAEVPALRLQQAGVQGSRVGVVGQKGCENRSCVMR
jgi:hypothetical protein